MNRNPNCIGLRRKTKLRECTKLCDVSLVDDNNYLSYQKDICNFHLRGVLNIISGLLCENYFKLQKLFQ